MKRLRITRLTIRKCEVNSDMNVDFTTTEDVIQEGYSIFHFESCDSNTTSITKSHCLIVTSVDHLSEFYFSLTYFLVVSIGVKLENLEQDWLVITSIA